MTFEDIQALVANDEHRCLELKKTTGELQDGMHTACAFLNTDGGWLLFGVAPKSLKILGQQVTDNTQQELAQALTGLNPVANVKPEYIDVPDRPGSQVIAIHFGGWKWGQLPYTYNGRPYYKVESTTKVMPQEVYEDRLRAAKPEKFAWERQVADDVTLADLDEKRIRGVVRLGVERGRMPATAETESIEDVISKWGLMRNGKVLNGAVALFGKNVTSYTQMSLRLARFRGTNKNEFVDSGRASGNYFDLLDAGMDFIFKHLSQSGRIVGFQKDEQLEIPAAALREALTNALCHRQLEKYNLTPGIAIYDDRVEIENPGRLTSGLTPENIKSSHASFPYNPLIADVLFKSSFLESWGSGVGRMVDACREQGLPEPEYELMEGFVKIIFRKKANEIAENQVVTKLSPSSHQVVTKLSPSIPMIGELLKKMAKEPMSAKDMRLFCGQTDHTYFKQNVIDYLMGEGLVTMTHPDSPKSPKQKYYLTENGKLLLEDEFGIKQADGVSEVKVNRLVKEFSDALPQFEIRLPKMESQYEVSLPVTDVRCFQASYKMKKEMFAEGDYWVYDTPELYLHEIQVNIWQHYNMRFLMHKPEACYRIRFSEIKSAFEALGLDGNYVVLTSFQLGTYDSLYGGKEAFVEKDHDYTYGDVEIFRIPSHEECMIVMRKEFLPRVAAKVFEGPDKEFKLINKEHLLYSNLFNMIDEGDGLGLAVMRDIKFFYPKEEDFRFVRLDVDRMERIDSQLDMIKSLK